MLKHGPTAVRDTYNLEEVTKSLEVLTRCFAIP